MTNVIMWGKRKWKKHTSIQCLFDSCAYWGHSFIIKRHQNKQVRDVNQLSKLNVNVKVLIPTLLKNAKTLIKIKHTTQYLIIRKKRCIEWRVLWNLKEKSMFLCVCCHLIGNSLWKSTIKMFLFSFSFWGDPK